MSPRLRVYHTSRHRCPSFPPDHPFTPHLTARPTFAACRKAGAGKNGDIHKLTTFTGTAGFLAPEVRRDPLIAVWRDVTCRLRRVCERRTGGSGADVELVL